MLGLRLVGYEVSNGVGKRILDFIGKIWVKVKKKKIKVGIYWKY